jgi:S-adenosylmethionine hydrolase
VAARLTMGLAPEKLGPPVDDLIMLDRPEVRILSNQIEGEITAVDSFGNLVTNITAEMLEGVPVDDAVGICCEEHETRGIFTTYSDQPVMTLIALIGSSGQLEMAIVEESAKIMLGVHEGAKVVVKW